MIGKVTSARNAGYKVNGVYVTVPTQTALDRALARGKETGRFVSPDVITNTHVGVSRTFPAITNQFDSLKLFDTSGTPKLIASGTKDNFEVLDSTLYQAFLDKGK
jgi:predicted ABC-type ATPase